MKKIQKLLAILLAATILSAPVSAAQKSQHEELSTAIPTVVSEEVSLREQSIKHFLLSDGSYAAVVYREPVHYSQNGEWREIDNSFVSASLVGNPLTGSIIRNTELTRIDKLDILRDAQSTQSPYTVSYLENKSNNFIVQIPKVINNNTPIAISHDNHSLRFCFDAAASTVAKVTQPKSASETAQEFQSKLATTSDSDLRTRIQNEHTTALPKSCSSAFYTSVRSGVDLNYYLHGQSLKEDLVFHTLPTVSSFSYNFTYTDLQAVLEKDNSVTFYDEDGNGIFSIAAPFMSDSDDGYSANVQVVLQKTTSGCRYTLIPDRTWLEDEQRVYPVTLDPTINTTQTTSYIHDNGVQQSDPNTAYMASDRIYVGSGVNSKEGRMYFKLTQWPSVNGLNANTITSAMMDLTYYPQANYQTGHDMIIDIYPLVTYWDTTDLTWNNQPYRTGSKVGDYHIKDSRNKTSGNDTLDVTSWVRAHYANPAYDYGIRLQPRTVSSSINRVCYISSDYYSGLQRPIIRINYDSGTGETAGVTRGETYYIKSAYSGKYLDAEQSLNNNVIHYTFHGNANQQWKVQYQSDGSYKIYSMYPDYNGKVLGITNQTNNNVAVLSDGSGDALRWFIVPNGDGSYRLYNKWGYADKAMTVDSTDNVCQAYWVNSSSQRWYFEKTTSKFTSMNTFSSFSIGNDNMSGYNYFNNYLQGRTLNNKQYNPLIKFNYTNGRIEKSDLLKYLTYSDVAFIDSHGYTNRIEMWDDSKTIYDSLYLSTDIGTSFMSGSTTKTNTPFNKKTKWVIIQACDQLNYSAQASTSDNSALQWAKALLGDGIRMHGVLSYHDKGPGGDPAGSKLNSFMGTQTNSSNRPNMITGWKLANEKLVGSSSWAGICHRQNLDDKLYWGWTADTANGSAYTIDRYSYSQGTQKPLPLSAPRSSTSTDSTIRLLSESNNIADQTFSLMNRPLTALQLQKLQKTLEPEKTYISSEGKLTYLNNAASPIKATSALSWTETQAVDRAKKHLDDLGLLPQSEYLIKTSTVVREELDVFNGTVSPAETVSWTIRFYQTYNGIPVVSKDDNGILITISENGLHSLHYSWKNIVPATKTLSINSARETLSDNEAIEKYSKMVDLKKSNNKLNVHYRQVYVYQDNTVIPAWVFGTEDAFLDPVYINAITGERMQVDAYEQ